MRESKTPLQITYHKDFFFLHNGTLSISLVYTFLLLVFLNLITLVATFKAEGKR